MGRILPFLEYTCAGTAVVPEILRKEWIETMNEIEIVSDPHRQQQLYWKEMINLKADATYIRLYRDSLGRWGRDLAR